VTVGLLRFRHQSIKNRTDPQSRTKEDEDANKTGPSIFMTSQVSTAVLSLMLAVPDTPAAVKWYKEALGARVLWSLGSVAGLEIKGAPFFLHQPVKNGFDSPLDLGATTARVELFVDDPDVVIMRALEAGTSAVFKISEIITCRGELIDKVGSPIHSGTVG
jgi:uncharacterized glyoxalase superfamily protein PhnB